ncbi:MAG: hypothetical protein ABIP13_09640 [Tepidiformaceae bacterium]
MTAMSQNRRQPYLFQPVEALTPFLFSEVVEEVRSLFFPEIERRVEVRIAAEGPLAFTCLQFFGPNEHMVAFHPILNHPGTPLDVVRFVAKHELTHIVRPGPGHPMQFWEHEYAIAPERFAAWHWIRDNLGSATREGTTYRVLKTWRRHAARSRTPYTPHLPLDHDLFGEICPGDGQLMLPPHWAPPPLPMGHR